MTDLRTAAQQALEALESWWDAFPHGWMSYTKQINDRQALEALRAALAEPVQEPVESALQAVAAKLGDQCAVWYGIGARDVEAVLREAARHGLVHGALAEPVQEPVGNSYADLFNALQRIETAAVFLPSFKITREGGLEAVVQNIVDAIAALAEPVQEPCNPSCAPGYCYCEPVHGVKE
jgi:hypothetical protein